MFLLLLVLMLPLPTVASPDTPLATVKAYFAQQLTNPEQYVCCEFADKGLPPINSTVTRAFELIQQDSASAVVAITLTDTVSGVGTSTYMHLQYDQKWKIAAYRALALPIFFFKIAAMSPEELMQFRDSVAQHGPSGGRRESREELLAFQRKMRLATATDAYLSDTFQRHKGTLEHLLSTLASDNLLKPSKSLSDTESYANFADPLQAIGITDVTVDQRVCSSCYWFVIESIADNSVGYVYAKDEAHLPSMSPDRYIVIRKVTDHWYIFRTT